MRSKTKAGVSGRALAGALCALVAGALVAVPSPAIADSLRPGSTTLVSHFPDGSPADGGHPAISSDGRYVAFESRQRLVATDTDNYYDIYRKDTLTGGVVIIPKVVAGVPHYRDQFHPSISDDGQKIAYVSGIFGNGTFEDSGYGVYAIMRDLAQATSIRLSRSSMFGDSVRLSGDGKWAALTLEDLESSSIALDFVDTATGQFHFFGGLCGGCGFSDPAPLSQSGRYVAYRHIDADRAYRHDRDADGDGIFDETGPGNTLTTAASIHPDGTVAWGAYPTISADGQKVGFISGNSLNLLVSQPFMIYVRDFSAGTTTLASKSTAGVPSAGSNPILTTISLSGNGRFVGFSSVDPLLVPGDFNPGWDVFLRDLSSSSTHLASTAYPDGSEERSDRMEPALSNDGRFVAFQSADRFGLGNRRIWLRDRLGTCSVICTDEVVEAVSQTIPSPPFDSSKLCWESGNALNGLQSPNPVCHTERGKDPAGPASLGRQGLLIVGGQDSFWGNGIGLPWNFWLAGVYLSSATRWVSVPQGTVTVNADISGEMYGQFEVSMTVCLRVMQFDQLLAQDCIANDAYHSEPIRALQASAPAAAGYVFAEVVLETSKHLGYARIKIDSLDINGQ